MNEQKVFESFVRRTVLSPLRYPGGKRRLVPYIAAALVANDLRPDLFVEPYAGGASVALELARTGFVDKIVLAERAERTLGEVDWIPVLPLSPAPEDLLIEAGGEALGLRLPLEMPENLLADPRPLTRVACLAAERGAGARFGLAADGRFDPALEATRAGLGRHGVVSTPVVRVGHRWFQGLQALPGAAIAAAVGELSGVDSQPIG